MRKIKNLRKPLALVLTLAMLASVCMVSAFASDPQQLTLDTNYDTTRAAVNDGTKRLVTISGDEVTDIDPNTETNVYDSMARDNPLTISELLNTSRENLIVESAYYIAEEYNHTRSVDPRAIWGELPTQYL